ncbi:7455_t:CDS:1, partial [Ambispora leptoticha]
MSTAREKAPLPTANEVEGWTETEKLIKFLADQNLGLDDDDFDILRKQK